MKLRYNLLALAFSTTIFLATAQSEVPKNWFNLDFEKDSIFGVSTERAYNEVLKGRKSKKIIVAVIDDGIDYKHEDLKDIIWVNKDEIPNNGKDDDNNGYIDDVHGWNFIGGKDTSISDDTYEITRLFRKLNLKYYSVDEDTLTHEDKKEYIYFKNKLKPVFLEKYYEASSGFIQIQQLIDAIEKIEKELGNNITEKKLKTYKANNLVDEAAVKNMLVYLGFGLSIEEIKNEFKAVVNNFKTDVMVGYNTAFDNRKSVVGDNYDDPTDRYYGNNDYKGPDGKHGTHVAGIIGAVRDNEIGIKGIADNIEIMIIRVVSNGDERDKDVANGIRYAVDNGASVINMSFGKAYSTNKEWVDEAVKYAEEKDVLLIHGAGNEAKNIDVYENYPTANYNQGGKAKNWIEVGASYWAIGKNFATSFSNYGETNVDVFAPGVSINSTTPDDKYSEFSGTSMASPVTAGVAALIRSYFPNLTAVQTKEILMKTVIKVDGEVRKPGTNNAVNLNKLCVSGGVVNAYKAVLLAAKTKGEKN
jgi:subtilisin family serine protease